MNPDLAREFARHVRKWNNTKGVATGINIKASINDFLAPTRDKDVLTIMYVDYTIFSWKGNCANECNKGVIMIWFKWTISEWRENSNIQLISGKHYQRKNNSNFYTHKRVFALRTISFTTYYALFQSVLIQYPSTEGAFGNYCSVFL